MRNVYDELFDKNLINIIPDSMINFETTEEVYKDTAIAVNLFYEDTLEKYFTYLNNVPKEIEVYIYSSNEKSRDTLREYALGRDNVFFYEKENRGRDISAFLVAFRKIALKKKYLCFLHDKKEKAPYLKKDTDYWIENLWGNTLHSNQYVKNILGYLTKREIGILTPPIPFGNMVSYWYSNRWEDEDWRMAQELAGRLNLNCDIDKGKMPIALGSVFWCKTAAIKKILEYNWDYKDFPAEPMPIDGTISHAIERLFAYAAQDAGYTTEWILCSQYAGSLILKSQMQMAKTFQCLTKNCVAENTMELERLDSQRVAVSEFCLGCQKVYLYGAGTEGRKFANWMHFWNLSVDGFVVTKRKEDEKIFYGLPVYEFKEIEIEETVGIIITVGAGYRREIEEIIKGKVEIKYYNPWRKM